MSQKSMSKEPNLVVSSLIAPFASLLVPAIISILVILTISSPQTDDAPVRAAILLLVAVLPVSYPVLAMFMAAVGYILKEFNKLTLRNLLIVYGLVCAPIAFLLGWPSPFGLKDQIIGLTVFFLLALLCLCIGAICWWYLAVGQGKPVYRELR